MTDDDRHRGRHRKRRKRRRRDDGQFAETVRQDDVRGVFDAVDGPVVTTTDVADVLGISTEAARTRLNKLVDREGFRRRKTGRTVVYWRRDDANDRSTEG